MNTTAKIIRQNPYGLKSNDFIEYIKHNNIITSPYGHSIKYTHNIMDNIYSENESKRQDKKFVEDLKIDDYVIIPIEKSKKFILKQIINSDIKYKTIELYLIKNREDHIIKIIHKDNFNNNNRENVNYTV